MKPKYQFLREPFGPLRIVVESFIVFIFTYAFYRQFAAFDFDPHHDGIMFKSAIDVAHGLNLFSQTFTQYGPATTYIHAAFISLLGDHLLSIKIATTFMYAVAAGSFYMVYRSILPASIAILAFATWLLSAYFLTDSPMLPWSSVVALGFQGLGALLLNASIRPSVNAKLQMIMLVFSGIATSMVFWSRQPIGVLSIVGVSVLLIVLRLRMKSFISNAMIASYGAGLVLGIGWFVSIMLAQHSLQQWYQQNVLWPRYWLGIMTVNTGKSVHAKMLYGIEHLTGPFQWQNILVTISPVIFMILLKILSLRDSKSVLPKALATACYVGFIIVLGYHNYSSSVFGSIMYIFPVCSAIFLAYYFILVIRIGSVSPTIIPVMTLGMMALASWSQYYPLSDTRHAFWGVTPSIPVFFIATYFATGKSQLKTFLLLFIVLARPIYFTSKGAFATLQRDYWTIETPEILAGIKQFNDRPNVALAPSVALDRLTKQHPNLPVINLTDDALYGTFTHNFEKPDAFNALYMWTGFPNIFNFNLQTRADFIHTKKPIIVVDTSYGPVGGPFERVLAQEFNYVELKISDASMPIKNNLIFMMDKSLLPEVAP